MDLVEFLQLGLDAGEEGGEFEVGEGVEDGVGGDGFSGGGEGGCVGSVFFFFFRGEERKGLDWWGFIV